MSLPPVTVTRGGGMVAAPYRLEKWVRVTVVPRSKSKVLVGHRLHGGVPSTLDIPESVALQITEQVVDATKLSAAETRLASFSPDVQGDARALGHCDPSLSSVYQELWNESIPAFTSVEIHGDAPTPHTDEERKLESYAENIARAVATGMAQAQQPKRKSSGS